MKPTKPINLALVWLTIALAVAAGNLLGEALWWVCGAWIIP